MRPNRLKNGILSIILMIFSVQLHADENTLNNENFQFHGFLTQGFTLTTDNNFFGQSSTGSGSLDFTEIGLNASVRLTPSILASAQILSRHAGELSSEKVMLDYGLVDFILLDAPDYSGGIRLGRTKTPYGFYNDTRDVAITRPGIFLPQSIYFDKVRNLILQNDGIQFYNSLAMDSGDLTLQLDYGTPSVDDNVEYAFLAKDYPGHVENDDIFSIFHALYEWQGGTVRLAYTLINGSIVYLPAKTFPLDLGKGLINMDLQIFSVEYNDEDWSITAEYMRENIDWRDFRVPQIDNNDHIAEGYYLQGLYRLTDTVELLLRYDILYNNKDDRDGTISASRPGAPPAFAHFAKDLTLGIRWDINSDFMLRAEYHDVNGTAWLSSQETPYSEMKQYWKMYNLLLSYHF